MREPYTSSPVPRGKRPGLEKPASKLDISKGLFLEPSRLPQTPGQGQVVAVTSVGTQPLISTAPILIRTGHQLWALLDPGPSER